VKKHGKTQTIRLALLVSGMSLCAAAQTSSPSQPETTPAPAFGQNAPVLNPENPRSLASMSLGSVSTGHP